MNYQVQIENDENRYSNRLLKYSQKKKIYSRVTIYKKQYINQIINSASTNIDDHMFRKKLLFDTLSYFNSDISEEEKRQNGEKFPFFTFFKYICAISDESEKFMAFDLLSSATSTGEASKKFYTETPLIEVCKILITNPQYPPIVLRILTDGSMYRKVGLFFLKNNICEILTQIPPSIEMAMLICNLTYFPNEYMANLISILDNILKCPAILASPAACCYAFKSVYHICQLDGIPESINSLIENTYIPIFYSTGDLFFNGTERRIKNTAFRFLKQIYKHFHEIPKIYCAAILTYFSSIDQKVIETKMVEEIKTVRLASDVLVQNAEFWRDDFSGSLLGIIFSRFSNSSYLAKLTLFNVLLHYYAPAKGTYDQFMEPMLQWSFMFIEEDCILESNLAMLARIVEAAKGFSDISNLIQSNISCLENIVSSGANETVLALATKILELYDE